MADLCELDDLKSQLGITDTAQDDTLERLIEAVSNDFMMETKRPDFAPAVDYVEWRMVGRQRGSYPYSTGLFSPYRNREVHVFLEHYPVNEIAKVTLNDVELSALASPFLAGPGYWFDPDLEDEERQKIILIDCGVSYYDSSNQLKVEYNGGYEVVPPVVSQAVIEWIAWRKQLGQIEQLSQAGGSVSAGSVTETVDSSSLTTLVTELPDNVKRAIAQYKRVEL